MDFLHKYNRLYAYALLLIGILVGLVIRNYLNKDGLIPFGFCAFAGFGLGYVINSYQVIKLEGSYHKLHRHHNDCYRANEKLLDATMESSSDELKRFANAKLNSPTDWN